MYESNLDEKTIRISDYILKDNGDQIPKDPINATQLELQSQVQGYIENLLDALKADRVLIHKFHNGGKYHTGVSTQKMKLVYEATKKRGRRIINELAGGAFVLEKMGGILKKVVDNKYWFAQYSFFRNKKIINCKRRINCIGCPSRYIFAVSW